MSGIRPTTWYCCKCLDGADMPCIFTADDEGLTPNACPFGSGHKSEWRHA